MKNLSIFIIAMLALCFNSNAADNYNIGDTLYVWAPSGLNVRTGPSTQYDKMGKLEIGDYVVVKSVTNKRYITNGLPAAHSDGAPFQLRGNWIEIENDQYYGFLVDTYLLKYKVQRTLSECLVEKMLEHVVAIDTIDRWENDYEEPEYALTYVFEDGTTYDSYGEYSIDMNEMILVDATIEEAFVLVNYYHHLEGSHSNGVPRWTTFGTYSDKLEIGNQDCALYIETNGKSQYISMECVGC